METVVHTLKTQENYFLKSIQNVTEINNYHKDINEKSKTKKKEKDPKHK
jgi:hypothetical protein